MAITKTEFFNGTILATIFVAGQLIAHKLGIGYEAGCLLSLTPIILGAGLLGINRLVKKMHIKPQVK